MLSGQDHRLLLLPDKLVPRLDQSCQRDLLAFLLQSLQVPLASCPYPRGLPQLLFREGGRLGVVRAFWLLHRTALL